MKIGRWWKEMKDRYGEMDKKDAFAMGRIDGMALTTAAKEERKRRKKLKKEQRKRR